MKRQTPFEKWWATQDVKCEGECNFLAHRWLAELAFNAGRRNKRKYEDRVTKKEKQILKLAQTWAKAHGCYIGGYSSYASDRSFTRADIYNKCGRALLKILQGDKS